MRVCWTEEVSIDRFFGDGDGGVGGCVDRHTRHERPKTYGDDEGGVKEEKQVMFSVSTIISILEQTGPAIAHSDVTLDDMNGLGLVPKSAS